MDAKTLSENLSRVQEHLKYEVAETARLRQLIREYARHTEGCSAAHGDQYRCRCGWREVAPEFVAPAGEAPQAGQR